MSIVTVEKVKQAVVKDTHISVLMIKADYKASKLLNSVSIMANYGVVIPDIFEIELDDDTDPQHALDDIVKTINNISFKYHEELLCPFCSGPLFHVANMYHCVNVDCIIDEDLMLVFCLKFKMILPDIPASFIIRCVTEMQSQNLPITITSLINYVHTKSDTEESDDSFQFVNNLSDVTLAQFFILVIGNQLSPDLQNIINFYNNDISKFVDDPSLFSVIDKLCHNKATTQLVKSMVEQNQPLLDKLTADLDR